MSPSLPIYSVADVALVSIVSAAIGIVVQLFWDSMTDHGLCRWTHDFDSGAWETECGHLFEVTDGTPAQNGMQFCTYCGQVLEVVYPHESIATK